MQGYHTYQSNSSTEVDVNLLVPDNHFLRKIDRIIDFSWVRELTKHLYSNRLGRPSIDPEIFFRMMLVKYFYNISSDRKLCEEIRYNMAYRIFCRVSPKGEVLHHSSMTRIRDRLGVEVYESFFLTIIDLCIKKGLVKGNRIITDSTLIDADASLDSMIARDLGTAKFEASRMVRNDVNAQLRSRKISNSTHISVTDPDSSLAKKNGKPRNLKYKIHTSIDADSRIILDNKVTTGACHETTIYLDRLKYIKSKHSSISINEVVADRAYGSAANIEFLKENNIKAFIPLFSTRSGKSALWEEKGFTYDKKLDIYTCPEGKQLKSNSAGGTSIRYASKASDCAICATSSTCTAKKSANSQRRCISRSINQDFYQKQMKFMKEKSFQKVMRERMWKIEGINAEAKQIHGLKRANYRGISKVQIQAYMTAIVQNIKRLILIIVEYFLSYICRPLYSINVANSIIYKIS